MAKTVLRRYVSLDQEAVDNLALLESSLGGFNVSGLLRKAIKEAADRLRQSPVSGIKK